MGTEADEARITEFFKSAREELLLRVAARDSWLRTHLTVQLTLLALGLGIPAFGHAESQRNFEWLLAAAPFLGVGVYLMYAVEDRLVGHLSNFLRDTIPGDHWDRAPAFADYRRGTLWWRYTGTVLMFVSLPTAALLLSDKPLVVRGLAAVGFVVLQIILLDVNRRRRAA